MRKHVVVLVLAALAAEGCGNKEPKLSALERAGPSDVVVAGQIITSEEITEPLMERLTPLAQATSLEEFKRQAWMGVDVALKDRISHILLYEEVKKEVGDRLDEALEKGAESEVRKFLVDFDGDYARAEEYLKQQGMDWDSFRERQKKLMLVSSRMPQPRPIAYNELLDAYETLKDEFFLVEGTITIRLIDIQAASLVSANPGGSPLEEARELAGDLARRIRSGEDFGALAKQYSHGHRREFGGLWKPRNPQSLAAPYDMLASEAEKMLPGQIAGPIETKRTEHIFIMRLEDKQPDTYKPFEEVQRQVANRIAFQRQSEAALEIDAKLTRQVPLAQRTEFVNLCLEKIHRLSNQ
ncbi:MAG: peptidylprolyl isomerase [Planctomycetota bacterium]|jgi:parvulin-like peptidyl-prolyl isomerase